MIPGATVRAKATTNAVALFFMVSLSLCSFVATIRCRLLSSISNPQDKAFGERI